MRSSAARSAISPNTTMTMKAPNPTSENRDAVMPFLRCSRIPILLSRAALRFTTYGAPPLARARGPSLAYAGPHQDPLALATPAPRRSGRGHAGSVTQATAVA
jgi:hypothetical protein